MAAKVVYTSRQGNLALTVPGVTLDNKSWDKFEGGGRTAETSTYPPGNMQPSIAVAGVSKRNRATIERAYDDTLIAAYLALDGAVDGPCSFTFTPKKNASTAAGSGITYTGIITEVNRANYDSTSSSVAMLQVIVELNEQIN